MTHSVSAADLLAASPQREFILLAGKDGSGKTSALVSVAALTQILAPTATFHILDTENKVAPVLRTWGGEVPTNIRYYACGSMNDVNQAYDEVETTHTPGDWLGVESAGRVWEMAQNMGYYTLVGVDKAEYLDKRRSGEIKSRKGGLASPIPQAVDGKGERFWDLVKGAHDTEFLNRIAACGTLNVMLTTTLVRPPRPRDDGSMTKENADRAALRAEYGLDAGLAGSPNLPTYALTLGLLGRRNGKVTCRILRDNLSMLDDPNIEFEFGKREWAQQLWEETGR